MAIINEEGILRQAEKVRKEKEEHLKIRRQRLQACLDKLNGYRDKLIDIADTVGKCLSLDVPINYAYNGVDHRINKFLMDGHRMTLSDDNNIYYDIKNNILGISERQYSIIEIPIEEEVSSEERKLSRIYDVVFVLENRERISRIEAFELFVKKLEKYIDKMYERINAI